MKHVANDIVKQKMDEYRAEILREVKMRGGLTVGFFFWRRARVKILY